MLLFADCVFLLYAATVSIILMYRYVFWRMLIFYFLSFLSILLQEIIHTLSNRTTFHDLE